MVVLGQSTLLKSSVSVLRIMRVLNVAEKNDAAKNISFFLSNGHSTRREGLSKFNKIYEFQYNVFNQNCTMVMTSVSGHLLNFCFTGMHSSWHGCAPEDLFDAPVHKMCPKDFENIKKTLEREARSADKLIIWTDCDREGENIGFEIIDTCQKVNPRIDVYRTKFSEITGPSIKRAISNLGRPNKNVSNAVDVRQELDLRTGAAFTRFQTLRLQRVFPVLAEHMLSYGSCQFPTLGFVVERYMERERFMAEPFWKIKVTHTIDNVTVEFRWQRDKLFDKGVCEALLARCKESPTARVEKIEKKQKSKWRPTPLDTTEMEKLSSRKLKINAKEALQIAEKLYTKGFISYPRTETNIFPSSINLDALVELQTEDRRWGEFARGVLQDRANPRQGKKSDQSHPPIHPIKYTDSLDGNEARIYELIVRHFLACVSKDAIGHETTVSIDINTEKFSVSGLVILERNYLDVYPYENWSDKNIHNYTENQTFQPTTLEMVESQTTAPNLLTEADLIALMEKHGIGTDATHAEHIEKIKSRYYVGLENSVYFVPSAIGMGLVEGYDSMGFAMSKPSLRAELEADLKRICDGLRQPQDVLREQIAKYRELYRVAKEQVNKIDAAVGKYIQETAVELNAQDDPLTQSIVQTKVFPCWLCGTDVILKTTADSSKTYLTCSAYPSCKASMWMPQKVLEVTLSSEACPRCGPDVKMLNFKFSPGSMAPYYPNTYTGCLKGCDDGFIDMLGLRVPRPVPASQINSTPSLTQTSGIGSSINSSTWNSSDNSASGYSRNDRGGNDRGFKRPREPPDDSSVVCLCSLPAKRLTARREGPNMGRDFLVCPKDSDDKCNFYAWADEIVADVKCCCELIVKRLTVKKEGPNQGKAFYCCPKSSSDRCNFFLWEEQQSEPRRFNDSSDRPPQTFRARGGSRGAGRGSWGAGRGSRGSGRESRGGAGRRCGNCNETGHNRRNCPSL